MICVNDAACGWWWKFFWLEVVHKENNFEKVKRTGGFMGSEEMRPWTEWMADEGWPPRTFTCTSKTPKWLSEWYQVQFRPATPSQSRSRNLRRRRDGRNIGVWQVPGPARWRARDTKVSAVTVIGVLGSLVNDANVWRLAGTLELKTCSTVPVLVWQTLCYILLETRTAIDSVALPYPLDEQPRRYLRIRQVHTWYTDSRSQDPHAPV